MTAAPDVGCIHQALFGVIDSSYVVTCCALDAEGDGVATPVREGCQGGAGQCGAGIVGTGRCCHTFSIGRSSQCG